MTCASLVDDILTIFFLNYQYYILFFGGVRSNHYLYFSWLTKKTYAEPSTVDSSSSLTKICIETEY